MLAAYTTSKQPLRGDPVQGTVLTAALPKSVARLSSFWASCVLWLKKP